MPQNALRSTGARSLRVDLWRIDGPFAVGTKGKSKPPSSRPLRFTLVAVEPDERFASEVKMPGGRLAAISGGRG